MINIHVINLFALIKFFIKMNALLVTLTLILIQKNVLGIIELNELDRNNLN